ncbi:hypothetical protein FMEXI_11335 [Fusarium mexicanum]|uniref:Uncharacterized protein n=1 Tax=Fusarium mexicanum TaxID=751941 RepID=A0A8H5MNL8_9HYPO|nr:hypothetical protein FMEXI_11335 [Fusarium mexicanum]
MENADPPQNAQAAVGNEFWQPADFKSKYNPFTDKHYEKDISFFFFKLTSSNAGINDIDQKRFYPLGQGSPWKWKMRKDGQDMVHQGELFVPEKYFLQWVIDSESPKKKLSPDTRYTGDTFPWLDPLKQSHRRFTCINEWRGPLNCRDADGQDIGQLDLQGHSGLRSLYQYLRQGRDRYVGANQAYPCTLIDDDSQSLNMYIPQDGYYVKLHSDQIGKLYTPGGGAPHIDEVYISQLVINYFSGVNLMDPDHPIPEFYHLFPSNAPDRKCFWVRNERGRPFQLTVEKEYGLINDAWAARYKKAARSIESAGGWNRCINPAIQLFIVPCPGVEIDFIRHCINAAKVKRTTRQDVTLISSEKLDEMTNEVALHWLGRSPMRHYETWIFEEDWNSYNAAYPQRPMPLSPVAIANADNKLAGQKQHAEAKDAIESINACTERDEDASHETATIWKKTDTNYVRIKISAAKMKAAKGRRDDVLTQYEVMGSSANEIAVILGWKDTGSIVPRSGKWPSPGVWPAEWLHRAAFSWGGLTGDYRTSQVPENLIFGTSECNSLMTRYEKYFQDYVRRCACTKKHYTFKLDTEIHRHPYANSELPDWLCYVMSYHFDVIEDNKVVATYSVDFHPFRRGFFTWFEQDLDTAILDCEFGELPVNVAREYDETAGLELDSRCLAFLPEPDETNGEQPEEPLVPWSEGGLGFDIPSTLFDGSELFNNVANSFVSVTDKEIYSQNFTSFPEEMESESKWLP